MASRRLQPYNVGEIVKLRSQGRGDVLFVVTPSRMEIRIPAPRGVVDLWLAEPGSWTIQWSAAPVESFDVVDAPELEPEAAEEPHVARHASTLSTMRI